VNDDLSIEEIIVNMFADEDHLLHEDITIEYQLDEKMVAVNPLKS
jgi:hypothetical protein